MKLSDIEFTFKDYSKGFDRVRFLYFLHEALIESIKERDKDFIRHNVARLAREELPPLLAEVESEINKLPPVTSIKI